MERPEGGGVFCLHSQKPPKTQGNIGLCDPLLTNSAELVYNGGSKVGIFAVKAAVKIILTLSKEGK